MEIFVRRLGDNQSEHKPKNRRSHATSRGARFRLRCSTNNWCLRAKDCATTDLTPPGSASLTKVVSKWAIRTNSSFMGSYIISSPPVFKTPQKQVNMPIFEIRDRSIDGLVRPLRDD